jgi:hypothetical protein
VWEIDDDGSFDDIEATSKVREICKSAAGSAERVVVLYFGQTTRQKGGEHLADG